MEAEGRVRDTGGEVFGRSGKLFLYLLRLEKQLYLFSSHFIDLPSFVRINPHKGKRSERKVS